MIPAEPHARRRGYFLSHTETDPDVGEAESPEGVTFRVRIIKPVFKRQIAGSLGRATSTSHPHRRSRPKITLTLNTGQHSPVK
jgi:hypothetical protein